MRSEKECAVLVQDVKLVNDALPFTTVAPTCLTYDHIAPPANRERAGKTAAAKRWPWWARRCSDPCATQKAWVGYLLLGGLLADGVGEHMGGRVIA